MLIESYDHPQFQHSILSVFYESVSHFISAVYDYEDLLRKYDQNQKQVNDD